MALRPEMVEWVEQLLAQTRAVLQRVETGEVEIAPEDLANLQRSERELIELLARNSNIQLLP